MRRLDLGGIVVFALTDCAPSPAARAYAFPDADFAAHPAPAARWLGDGFFHTRFGAFLVRTGETEILVDCGLGADPVAYFPDLRGNLAVQLAEAGTSPNSIGAVLFTHLHVDHVGWATTAAGAPRFPHARYLVGLREWTHWSTMSDFGGLPHHVAAVRRSILPLASAKVLQMIEADTDLPRGLTLLPTPGHTPGHQSILVTGADGKLLIAGDVWHSPAQVAVPEWGHRADMDPAAAIAMRRHIAEQAMQGNWLIGAGHFVENAAFGRIAGTRQRPEFEPLQG